VEFLPAEWDSFQRQGNLFAEISATVDLLSEVAAADGLLFSPGQSRSIGVPFVLRSDADGSGAIDLTDFAIWKSNQGQSLQGPSFGDFDWSGLVDLDDFESLLNEMGNSAVYTFEATTAVPEPSALILLSIGFATLFAVRRVVRRYVNRMLPFAAGIALLVAFASAAQADIYQWEYINPADPSQGKQQSTTLAPRRRARRLLGTSQSFDGVSDRRGSEPNDLVLREFGQRRFKLRQSDDCVLLLRQSDQRRFDSGQPHQREHLFLRLNQCRLESGQHDQCEFWFD
jgi:hypothetical protein